MCSHQLLNRLQTHLLNTQPHMRDNILSEPILPLAVRQRLLERLATFSQHEFPLAPVFRGTKPRDILTAEEVLKRVNRQERSDGRLLPLVTLARHHVVEDLS